MSAPLPDSSVPASDTRVHSQRLFPWKQEVVFAAFANPELLEQWWGPEGFSLTMGKFDFQPGGVWQFVMQGPDGKKYVQEKKFLVVEPPERIVMQHPQPEHQFVMTMTYTRPDDSSTLLTWDMEFQEPLPPEMHTFLEQANQENFDRLASLLKRTCSG